MTALRGVDARRILEAEFGASYSLSGTFNLLHRLHLSWLCPRPSHPKSDAREAFGNGSCTTKPSRGLGS